MDKSKGNHSNRLVNTKDQERNINKLSITSLQQRDSGTYYCELMILSPPSKGGLRGNGSRLIVTEPDSWKNKSSWLYLLLCPFIILLLAVCSWKAKQKQLVECNASSTRTVPEATSGPDGSTYATLFSSRIEETPQNVNLEVVYSDPLKERNAPNPSTDEMEYSAVKTCKAEAKAQSGNGQQMIYSQLQFKENNKAQLLTPRLQ
ncbi:uncharacterized protein [Heptranchias perlo]